MNNQPFRMRPMFIVLMRGSDRMSLGLYQLYLATPEQLCRLHYSPGSLKGVKRWLKELADQGYVQAKAFPVKHKRPDKTFFSARYYYSLTSAGLNYLEGLEMDVREAWPSHQKDDEHGLFVEHSLELNDVIIAAALLARTDPRFSLLSFTHERVLKRKPYKATLSDGQTVSLIPDAFLEFGVSGTQLKMHVLLEHDRGTEEQFHFKRKIRAYLAFLRAESDIQQFGKPPAFVAFTTFKGTKRLEQMREWTRQVFQTEGIDPKIGQRFLFADLPQPLFPGVAWLEPRWFTAYDTNQPPEPLLVA